MTDRAPTLDELRVTEERLARLSVLQELTSAALALTDPEASVDAFMQHVAERMSCVAVVWISRERDTITLEAEAGISRPARRLAIEGASHTALVDVTLPYPETSSVELESFRLSLDGVDDREHALSFHFERTRGSVSFEAMVRRVAEVFQRAIAHRSLVFDLQYSYHELERAQRALVLRERLAALGEMAAAVAHEVRNPLGVIFNSIATLKKLLVTTDDAEELLTIVDEEARRLNGIVTDLLEFAKPGGTSLQEMAIDEAITAAIDASTSASGIPEGLVIEARIDDDLPPVELDARLMRQALLNLIANAVQVSPRAGRVLVHAHVEGDELHVSVSDQGEGIEQEARQRLFEPFFTTKSSGTGLGLAIVKRIVEAHNGRIEVTSDDGAVFTVALPIPK